MTTQTIEEAVEEVLQEVMSDVGKYYRVSDSLSDILSDSLGERLTKALQAQRDAGARAERPRILAALPEEMIVHEYMPEENTPARRGWNDYRVAAIKALTPLPDKE